MMTVCMERPLPFFYSSCETIFLPDYGWNWQPKHVVELNKNELKRSI